MTDLYNPSIEQSLVQTWEHNFITLAQQENSLLGNLPAVKMMVFDSYKHNVARTEGIELDEYVGRNPKLQDSEPLTDNRRFFKRRYGKSFLVDKKDIREAMADIKSEIYKDLFVAVNKLKDRIIARAATGLVEVGDPNNGGTSYISAATDGVKTVDATGGLTYNTLKNCLRYFSQREVCSAGDIDGANLSFICGDTDHSQLLGEDKFINNLYTISRPVDSGSVRKVLGMSIVCCSGSETGEFVKKNPILNESGTTRDCLLLAPNAIAFTIDNLKFDYEEKAPGYVDSARLSLSVEMGAMRLEGARVQIVQTTF